MGSNKLKKIIMEKEKIIVISVVRDPKDNTILIVRKKEEATKDAFPADIKPIGENEIQCAIRATYEQTGVTIKNPVEVARVNVEVQVLGADNSYEAVFFLSTDFSGSLHPAAGTDIVWQQEGEIRCESTLPAYVIRHILDGHYLSGTYNYADDEFTIGEIRDR